jgi:hypothetical protein
MARQTCHPRDDDEHRRFLPGQLDKLRPLLCRRLSRLAIPPRLPIRLPIHSLVDDALAP